MTSSCVLVYFISVYGWINWINLASGFFYLLYITISVFRKERNLSTYIMAVLFVIAFLGNVIRMLA